MKRRTRLNVSILVFTLILLLLTPLLFFFPPDFVLSNRTLALRKYQYIESCVDFEKQFKEDQLNNELRFFLFGLPDERGDELYLILKSNYNIELLSMGCVVNYKYDCYNQMVNAFLIEKFNDSSLTKHCKLKQ